EPSVTDDGAMSVADATRSTLLAVRLRPGDAAGLTRLLSSMAIVVDDLETLLERLERAGLVERRAVDRSRWRLTDDGRSEGERLLGLELDDLDARPNVRGAYERYLPLNGALLRVCTDWQLRDDDPASPTVNDHTDTAYDAAVIARLGDVHAAVVPICDE